MLYTLHTLLDEYPVAILAGFIALLVGVAAVFVKADNRAETAFMADCLKERKQYECTAMWRAGENHTAIMPVFIPINSGR